jgi:hypothetical protein
MPSGVLPVVKRVFAIIHSQTGGTFHFAGYTTRRWQSTTHSVTRPTIYISFSASHNASGYSMSQTSYIGWGQILTNSRAGVTAQGTTWSLMAATHGDVVLYAPAHLAKRFGGGDSWQALILHEVGHALDLAHRSSSADIMYPRLRVNGPGRFSPTEVKRLRAVLKRTGCDYDHLRYLSPRPGGSAYTVPSAPTDVSASAPSSTSATIRWAPPSATGGAPVIGYRVARGSSGADGGPQVSFVPPTDRSFTFTGLTPNTGYYIDVQPITAIGYGSGMRTLVIVPPSV